MKKGKYLSELKKGDSGKILKIRGEAGFRGRLQDMGLIPGCVFKIVKTAPLGDPLDIYVRGYHLSLRKEEAGLILVELDPQS